MFTGIIEEVGTVKQITHGQHSEVLNIDRYPAFCRQLFCRCYA